MANITLEQSVTPPLPTPGRIRLFVDSNGHLIQLDSSGAMIDLTAGVGAVASVNGQTGVVVLDADDIDDAATANKFTTVADIAKLAGIQAGAQVNTVNSVNGQTGDVVLDADDIDDTATIKRFTTLPDIVKLAGIQSGAQVNTVNSVNGQTGVVVLDADDIDDAATANKFTTVADIAKLAGIQAGAQVNTVNSVNGQTGAVVLDFAEKRITFTTFTASFTLATNDLGKTFVFTGSGEANVTVPDEVAVNLGAGFNVEFRHNGTGRVNFTGSNIVPSVTGGVTLRSNGRARLSYPAQVTNQWLLDGDTTVTSPTVWVAMTPVGLNSGNGTPLWREVEYSPHASRWLTAANNGWASITSDKGATWTAMVQNLASGASNQASRGLQANNTGVVVSLWANGFASRSINNGTSWTVLTAGLNSGSATAQWFGLATDGNNVFVAVAQTGYAARSVDAGATWSVLVKGLNSGDVNANFNDVETNGSGVFMAIGFTNSQCARSLDNGATWVSMTPSTTVFQQANCISFETGSTWYIGANGGYVLKTTDNGATWVALQQGLGLGFNGNILESDSDGFGNTIFVGTGGFAAITTNGGVTFTLLPAYLNSGASGATDISAIETDRKGNWLAVLTDGRAARSVI